MQSRRISQCKKREFHPVDFTRIWVDALRRPSPIWRPHIIDADDEVLLWIENIASAIKSAPPVLHVTAGSQSVANYDDIGAICIELSRCAIADRYIADFVARFQHKCFRQNVGTSLQCY